MTTHKVAHTPYQWREQLEAVDGRYRADGWTCEVRTVESGLVAVAIAGDKHMAEANARLIAAAPDLLAACKALLLNVDSGFIGLEWTDSPGVRADTSAMCAAIARAEGSQP